MTPNADDLIEVLKKLVDQIDSLDGKTKSLVHNTHELNKTVKLTKEYHNELGVLNNLSESQPRSSLIYALQNEIKQVRQLDSENSELRSAIVQHEEVLAIIMGKYREQSKQLERINQLEAMYRISGKSLDSQRYKYLQEKVNEMVLVMDKACEMDEDKAEKQQRLICKLQGENNRIKKLLLNEKFSLQPESHD